jgi:hypothetical protein
MIRVLLPLALAGLLAACPPSPVPPPQPDASDAASPLALADGAPSTPCQAACSALARLGCPEGLRTSCYTVLSHIDGAGDIATPCGSALCPPMTCTAIAKVTSIAQVRTQGVPCAVPGGGVER